MHLGLAITENNLDDITTEKQLTKVLEQPRKDYLQKFNLSKNLEEMELKELQKLVKDIKDNQEENIVLAELEAATRPLDNVNGIYFVVDIGAGTVDASSCFIRTKAEIDYYHTSLEEIGVATLSISEKETFSNHILDKIEDISAHFPRGSELPQGDFRANKYLVSANSIEKKLELIEQELELIEQELESKKGDFRANKHLVSANSIKKELESKTSFSKELLKLILFQQELHQQIGDLVIETKHKEPKIKNNNTLNFVLIGGGSRSKLYEDTIFATHKAFKQERASIPEYDVRKFTNPNEKSREKGLVMGDVPQQYFDRYLVAYGLSIPGKSNLSKFPEGFSLENQASNKYKYDFPKEEWRERANLGIGCRLS